VLTAGLAATLRTFALASTTPLASGIQAAVVVDEATQRLIGSHDNYPAAKHSAYANSPSSRFVRRKVRVNNCDGVQLSFVCWPYPVATVVSKWLFNREAIASNLKLAESFLTQVGAGYTSAWD